MIDNGLTGELRVEQESIQNIDLHQLIVLYNFLNLRCQIIGEGHGELVAYRKKCQVLISAGTWREHRLRLIQPTVKIQNRETPKCSFFYFLNLYQQRIVRRDSS